MRKTFLSMAVGVATVFSAAADTTYQLVTSFDELAAGDKIIVVCKSVSKAMGASAGNFRNPVDITVTNNEITLADDSGVQVVTLEESGNADFPWFMTVGENTYLCNTSTSNYLQTKELTSAPTADGYFVEIAPSESSTIITFNKQKSGSYYQMKYNSSSPRFATYTSGQTDVQIFKEKPGGDVELKPAELSFSPEELTVTMGEAYTLPTLANPNNLAVTYTSSDETVATVNADGTLELVGAGVTTITATTEETAEFAAGKATYTLTVIDPNKEIDTDLTFVFKDMGYVNAEAVTTVGSEGEIQMIFDKSTGTSAPAYYTTGTAVRIYNGNTITFKCPEGYYLTEIVINAVSNYGVKEGNYTISSGAFSTEGNVSTWTPSEQTDNVIYSHTNKDQLRIVSVQIKCQKLSSPLLKNPEISFPEAEYSVIFGEEFESPVLKNENGVTVTYTSTVETVATVDATGKVTVVGPGTTQIKATSEATETYYASEAYYTLNVISIEDVDNLASFTEKSLADQNLLLRLTCPLTVAYADATNPNGNYVYVTDGSTFGMMYGKNELGYKQYDIIPAGWAGKITDYNGTPEIKFEETLGLKAAEETGEFTPEVMKLADMTANMVNTIGVAENVTFASFPASGKTTNGVQDGVEYQFYNRFGIEGENDTPYDVTFATSIYRGEVQFYPIALTPSPKAPAVEPVIKLNGTPVEDEEIDLKAGDTLTFEFDVPDGTEVYYRMAYTMPETQSMKEASEEEDGYTKYEGGAIAIEGVGEFSYYTVTDGEKSAVKTYRISGVVTAIDRIEADEADAVYYDMQGRKLTATPAAGLYIRVRGTKTDKIVIR